MEEKNVFESAFEWICECGAFEQLRKQCEQYTKVFTVSLAPHLHPESSSLEWWTNLDYTVNASLLDVQSTELRNNKKTYFHWRTSTILESCTWLIKPLTPLSFYSWSGKKCLQICSWHGLDASARL